MAAKEWGIPLFEQKCPKFKGTVFTWIPGVRVDVADWYLILYHTGDLRRYGEAGGDYSKVIVHFLTHDAGVIEPLWGNKLSTRIRFLLDLGITHIIAPDFSAWALLPLAVQLYEHYRSMVVTHDLCQAGFTVIPNVCWSSPQLREINLTSWNLEDQQTILVDANHTGRKYLKADQRLFWDGARQLQECLIPDRTCVWLYVSTPYVAKKWQTLFGAATIIYSRIATLRSLSKFLKRLMRSGGEENG